MICLYVLGTFLENILDRCWKNLLPEVISGEKDGEKKNEKGKKGETLAILFAGKILWV